MLGLARSGTSWLLQLFRHYFGCDTYYEPYRQWRCHQRHTTHRDPWLHHVFERKAEEPSPLELYSAIMRGEHRSPERKAARAAIKEPTLLPLDCVAPQLLPIALLRHPLRTAESALQLAHLSSEFSRKDRFFTSPSLLYIGPSARLLDLIGMRPEVVAASRFASRKALRDGPPRATLGWVTGLLHRLMLDFAVRNQLPVIFYEQFTEATIASMERLAGRIGWKAEKPDLAAIEKMDGEDSPGAFSVHRETNKKRMSPDDIRALRDDPFMLAYHELVPELYDGDAFPYSAT